MKTLILSLAICLVSVATVSAHTFASINEAAETINEIMATAPTKATFDIKANGEVVKHDEYDVTYEFNLNSIGVIQYEEQNGQHFVKLACTTGNKCFYSEDNMGEGVLHYLQMNSKEEAERLVAALNFIKANVTYY